MISTLFWSNLVVDSHAQLRGGTRAASCVCRSSSCRLSWKLLMMRPKCEESCNQHNSTLCPMSAAFAKKFIYWSNVWVDTTLWCQSRLHLCTHRVLRSKGLNLASFCTWIICAFKEVVATLFIMPALLAPCPWSMVPLSTTQSSNIT